MSQFKQPLQFGEVRRVIVKRHNAKKATADSDSSSSDEEHPVEGRIYRAPAGSGKDYYVYYKGKKISFGDSSMPNRQNNDEARKNFRSRHNCEDKKDKTKAGCKLSLPYFSYQKN